MPDGTMNCAIKNDNALFRHLERVRRTLGRAAWGTIRVIQDTEFGDSDISYGVDDTGDQYALLAFLLPDAMYAEVEDGTYGQLQAFRIYMDDV